MHGTPVWNARGVLWVCLVNIAMVSNAFLAAAGQVPGRGMHIFVFDEFGEL
jgi:hypothetical protein